MNAVVKLDASNRILITRTLREAAGIARRQRLKVSATPGRIILEVEPSRGKVIKRGRLKVWTGNIPSIALAEAVERVRNYRR